MWHTYFVGLIFSIGLTVVNAGIAFGQNYPNKSIRIVTGGVGGSSDFAVRLITPELAANLGQPVIVENRGGNVPGELVAKATSDGYTLLFAGGAFSIAPLLQKLAYDPVLDFAPITVVTSYPNILVVHPSMSAKSVKELIALAKAKPGELNYASGGVGGTDHLAGELFKSMAGVNMVHVPYKSGGAALNEVVGGQVQLWFATAGAVAPHVKSGKVRALAVTSAQPSARFPGLPTIAASGVPGYDVTGYNSIFVPAKTPDTIIKRLNEEIVRALSKADVKEKFFNAGVETVGSSPQQLAATMKSDIAKMGKVIKDAGIRAD